MKESMEILLATTVKNNDVNKVENKVREMEGREGEGLRRWKRNTEKEMMEELSLGGINSIEKESLSKEESNKDSSDSDESESKKLKEVDEDVSVDVGVVEINLKDEKTDRKTNKKKEKKQKKKNKKYQKRTDVPLTFPSTSSLPLKTAVVDTNFYDSPFSVVSPLVCSNYLYHPPTQQPQHQR
jgi:hypothetical protein